jgi:POT family proton-dependent oligopeptide transporter
MLKNHPKGLLVAFFANMGERFGFYTMMACLVFFLQSRYDLSASAAGSYYSWFYFAIYALALFGGIIADATQKYKTVVLVGIITMLGGYMLMATPGLTLNFSLLALLVIAMGNGLFKGNLQALVGQMYDAPEYAHLRDSAFSIFYMGINVGAFFAPSAANGIRNWYLSSKGFTYDADLASLCNQYIGGRLHDITPLQNLAAKASTGHVTDLMAFSHNYISAFATGYNYAFGVAACAMIISLVVYVIFMKKLPNKQKAVKAEGEKLGNWAMTAVYAAVGAIVAGVAVYFISFKIDIAFAFGLFGAFVAGSFKMSTKEERPRVIALMLVFVVVMFFWMSFHQNGLTLSFFARDYVLKAVAPFTYLFFDIKSLLTFIAAIYGIVLLISRKSTSAKRGIGALLLVVGGGLSYWMYTGFTAKNAIEPEIFQQFNPIFIVFLTPVVVGFFAWLNARKKEPSTPKKIGIGMILAAVGFTVVLFASLSLQSPHSLAGAPTADRISPYWLISTYFVLTIAELFLSPMGISFVSKVAPARFQGLMQGGWLLATALGNKLLVVGSIMWEKVELWQLWAIFVVCCLVSAAFIFSILKKLEKVTS